VLENSITEQGLSGRDGQRAKRKAKKHRRLRLQAGRFLATLIVVTIMSLILAARFAILVEWGYEIDNLKTRLDKVKSENERLRWQVSELESLERVEKLAKQKLGMITPGSYRLASAQAIQIQSLQQGAGELDPGGGRTEVIALNEPGTVKERSLKMAQAGVLDRANRWFYHWLTGNQAEARTLEKE
jgi:cell division protein FtsL